MSTNAEREIPKGLKCPPAPPAPPPKKIPCGCFKYRKTYGGTMIVLGKLRPVKS